MSKKLNELIINKEQYQPQDKAVIESLQLEAKTLEVISQMKETEGWKVLGKKLREELHNEIAVAVKDNTKISILLQILSTVETKNATKLLDDEIEKLIPT